MIEVCDISKVIKGKEILSDIYFVVEKGECVALIGPNGAGKTTLMSCLIGDKKVTSGQVKIDAIAPKSPVNKARIAVLGQENVIPERLTVGELIAFFQQIYLNPLTIDEIRALLGLTPSQENQLTEKLSGGQKRLLSFVICLIGQPQILFLDEPTTAMDTTTRQRFWEIISQIKEKGMTILYSSHYVEEVEQMADRILVLHQGKLLRDTTPFAMRNEVIERQVTLPSRLERLVMGLSHVYGCYKKP